MLGANSSSGTAVDEGAEGAARFGSLAVDEGAEGAARFGSHLLSLVNGCRLDGRTDGILLVVGSDLAADKM